MTLHNVAFEVNYHGESSGFLEEQSAALLSMYYRFCWYQAERQQNNFHCQWWWNDSAWALASYPGRVGLGTRLREHKHTASNKKTLAIAISCVHCWRQKSSLKSTLTLGRLDDERIENKEKSKEDQRHYYNLLAILDISPHPSKKQATTSRERGFKYVYSPTCVWFCFLNMAIPITVLYPWLQFGEYQVN